MASMTLNSQIPTETSHWLERRAGSRGNPGAAAAQVIKEAKRHGQFRGVEFRSTSLGRIAYVQDSSVAVYFAWMTARHCGFDWEKSRRSSLLVATANVRSALAYAAAFPEEIHEQVAAHGETDDETALHGISPSLNVSARPSDVTTPKPPL
jgi:hypothetical protein